MITVPAAWTSTYCPRCGQKGHKGYGRKRPVRVDEEKRIYLEKCPDCEGINIIQDPDVLDTWFSSWLWPFATLGWPFTERVADSVERIAEKKKDLEKFYPSDVLVTAQEIIFFWVARMIMAGFEFMGDIPFKDVYIHGTVRDETGRKMSKSLGNSIDPLEVIKDYGTDALRFSLISLTPVGQDVYLSTDKFESGRNFANKIWNASRFLLMNMDLKSISDDVDAYLESENLPLAEQWILSKLQTTVKDIDKALAVYRLNDAASMAYDFFWHQFCDYYIELAKPTIKEKQTQYVLFSVLEKSLRILHPFMPFLTEEIFNKVRPDAGSIMLQPWVKLNDKFVCLEAEKKMGIVLANIATVRNWRNEVDIKPKQKVDLYIKADDTYMESVFNDHGNYLVCLTNTDKLIVAQEENLPEYFIGGTSCPSTGTVLIMKCDQEINIEAELKKTKIRMTEVCEFITKKDKLLSNERFASNAPAAVIDKEKISLQELQAELDKLKTKRLELEQKK